MAVRIADGIPGSGKSYYIVNHLAKTYFEKQEDGRYEPIKDVLIITNIDSFKPPHLSLQTLMREAAESALVPTSGLLAFFDEHYQQAFSDCVGKPIIYMIDEAQKIFRKGDRTLSPVYSYFEMHRHFGQDIYLVTQNSKKLPPDISCLAEYVIHALPRTRAVVGEFKYHWLDDGDRIKTEALKPDKGIFALYKSMDQKESEKIKNPVMRTVLQIFAILILLFSGIGYYFKSKWIDPYWDRTDGTPSVSSAAPAAPGQPPSSAVSLTGPSPSPTVHLRLSSAEYFVGDSRLVFLVFNGEYVPLESFEYKSTLKKIMGTYYADVPASAIIAEKQVSEPSVPASSSAFSSPPSLPSVPSV